jgi:predicted O-linked N-acetylglucosamine transferase (SPINDLY family)
MVAAAAALAPDFGAELDAARCDILQGRATTAVARLRALAADDPSNPLAAYWLAAALGATGRWEEHRTMLRAAQILHADKLIEACGIDPARMRTDPVLAAQVAEAFYAQHMTAVASVAFAHACAQATASLQVMLGHGLSLQHQGRTEEAVQAFRRACLAYPNAPAAHSFLLYALFYQPEGVRLHAEEARRWAKAYDGLPIPPRSSFANAPLDGRPLRVGYVLPTAGGGQARQFLLPILDDEAAAALIRRDCIDVLVDLWGHTAGGRLGVFARKPAPVQASWLNYVQTTGLEAIDYLVHADCMDGAQDHCAEIIWRLGPTICLFRPDPRPEPSPTPALAAGYVTFASYNHPARLNDDTVAAWSAILKRVPGSRLILRYRYFQDAVLQNVTLMRFAAHGIEPDRIQFPEPLSQPDYYRSYAEIDLALDPSPNPGGTTSLDAVANGVPLLTLAGEDYFSRIGVAVVGPLGLDELIAESWPDYIERAVALACDIPALNALRARVRQAFDSSERVDEAGFTRRLEGAWRDMFSLWSTGRKESDPERP